MKEEITKKVTEELLEVLSDYNLEGSLGEVVEVNEKEQTITIKFNYNVVPEDNYIGLGSY